MTTASRTNFWASQRRGFSGSKSKDLWCLGDFFQLVHLASTKMFHSLVVFHQPTHLNKYGLVKMGSSSPKFGVKIPKNIWVATTWDFRYLELRVSWTLNPSKVQNPKQKALRHLRKIRYLKWRVSKSPYIRLFFGAGKKSLWKFLHLVWTEGNAS